MKEVLILALRFTLLVAIIGMLGATILTFGRALLEWFLRHLFANSAPISTREPVESLVVPSYRRTIFDDHPDVGADIPGGGANP